IPIENEANPLRFAHLKQMHPDLRVAPPKAVDGTLMDVLIAPNDLAESRFYFNASTHLLERIEEKGETSAYFTTTTTFEDYRAVDGVQFPFRIARESDGKGGDQSDLKVKDVKNNV